MTTRQTPVDAALELERSLARRWPRARAALWVRIVGRDGPTRVPHRLAWRMRAQVGATPPKVMVHPGTGVRRPEARRVLLIGNDLSRSGAPQLLVEIARSLLAAGSGVTLASPVDGPLRETLVAAGSAVIVDPAIRDPGAPLLAALSGSADAVICNTIDTDAAVMALAPSTPVFWYVHEVSLLEERLATRPTLAGAIHAAARVWAGSELPARLLRPLRPDVAVLPYGLDPVPGEARAIAATRPLRLVTLASFEPRKGQDLLLDALALLTPAQRAGVRLDLYGRALFADFHAGVAERAAELGGVALHGPLDESSYRAALLGCDALVVPSRDDTLPLVSLDALGAGRVLICTRTTGTAAWLEPGRSGFVAAEPTAAAIADALREAIARADEWPAIGAAGRAAFERHFSKAAFSAAIERELAAAGVPAP